jgi:hypothetical protein
MNTLLEKILVGVLTFFVLGAITGSWVLLNDFWQVQATVTKQNGEIKTITVSLGERQEADVQIMKQNQQILGALSDLREYTLTKRGRADICEGGEDEEFILVNTRGVAEMYSNFKEAQVTVKDTTLVLPIKGTVKGSPLGPMILISKKAARNLGVTGEIGGVLIEPVNQK